MKTLDISYNGFGCEGTITLSNALSCNQSLQELDISHNRVTDEAINPLCKVLNNNHTLLHLKVSVYVFCLKIFTSVLSKRKRNDPGFAEKAFTLV